jgi:hypothetical protein
MSIERLRDGAEVGVESRPLAWVGVVEPIRALGTKPLELGAPNGQNRRDFGIEDAGMPDDLIRDDVVIKLDLSLKKKS